MFHIDAIIQRCLDLLFYFQKKLKGKTVKEPNYLKGKDLFLPQKKIICFQTYAYLLEYKLKT